MSIPSGTRIRRRIEGDEGVVTKPNSTPGFVDVRMDGGLQKALADSPKSWSVAAESVNLDTFDLSVKNPNGGEAVVHRSPADILDEIAALDAEAAEVLGNIRGLLA